MQSLTDKLNWYIFSKSPILDPEHAQGCIEYASLEAQTRFGPETLRLVLGAPRAPEAPWEPCPDDETLSERLVWLRARGPILDGDGLARMLAILLRGASVSPTTRAAHKQLTQLGIRAEDLLAAYDFDGTARLGVDKALILVADSAPTLSRAARAAHRAAGDASARARGQRLARRPVDARAHALRTDGAQLPFIRRELGLLGARRARAAEPEPDGEPRRRGRQASRAVRFRVRAGGCGAAAECTSAGAPAERDAAIGTYDDFVRVRVRDHASDARALASARGRRRRRRRRRRRPDGARGAPPRGRARVGPHRGSTTTSSSRRRRRRAAPRRARAAARGPRLSDGRARGGSGARTTAGRRRTCARWTSSPARPKDDPPSPARARGGRARRPGASARSGSRGPLPGAAQLVRRRCAPRFLPPRPWPREPSPPQFRCVISPPTAQRPSS